MRPPHTRARRGRGQPVALLFAAPRHRHLCAVLGAVIVCCSLLAQLEHGGSLLARSLLNPDPKYAYGITNEHFDFVGGEEVVDSQSEGLLNNLLQEMWPQFGGFIETMLKTDVQEAMQQKLPPVLKSLGFGAVNFGDTAMMLNHSVVQRVIDGKRSDLKVTLGLHWDADISVGIRYSLGTNLVATHVNMNGPLVIYLVDTMPRPPFFAGMQLYFKSTPHIGLDLLRKTMGSHKYLDWIDRIISDVVEQQIEKQMVIPNAVKVVLDQSEPFSWFRVERILPQGILTLRILGADGLAPKDFSLGVTLPFGYYFQQVLAKLFGYSPAILGPPSSDPYCELAIGGQRWFSSTKLQTLNPTWDEEEGTQHFLIHSLNEQKLLIRVFDADNHSQDDFIGKHKLPVETLVRNGGGELELTAKGVDGLQGVVKIQASWADVRLNPQVLKSAVTHSSEFGEVAAHFVLFVGVNTLFHKDAVPDTGLPGSYLCEVEVQEDEGAKEIQSKEKRLGEPVNQPPPSTSLAGEDQGISPPHRESVFQTVLTEVISGPLPDAIRFTVKRGPRSEPHLEPEVVGFAEYELQQLVDAKDNTDQVTLRLEGQEDSWLSLLVQLRVTVPPAEE